MDGLFDVAILALAILGLGAFEVVGRRIWLDPIDPVPSRDGRWMSMLVILTFAGGAVGSFSWWFDVAGSFAWDLPALAGRMLGSAGWSFAFAAFLALQRPTYLRMRLVMLMLLVYLAPLAVVILLLHLDRLDFTAPITYPFLVVVALLSGGAGWFLWRRSHVLPSALEPHDAPPPSTLRAWLLVVAAITAAWSVALAITDDGPVREIWAWPGDPLSSRLIAAMLITVATCSAWASRHADPARVMTGVGAIYGLGLLIASVDTALGPRAMYAASTLAGYVVTFAVIGIGSAFVIWREGGPQWRRLASIRPDDHSLG